MEEELSEQKPSSVHSFAYSAKEDNLCYDCSNDSYQDKLCEYLQFKKTGTFSDRIRAIKHPKAAEKQKYCIYYCAKKFQIYQCQFGSLHLERFGKKVPMIKQALRLVHQGHGQYHRDPQTMINWLQAKHPNIIFYYIRDFIYEFPLFCGHCRSQSISSKKEPQPISRIWHHLLSQSNAYIPKNSSTYDYLGFLDCQSEEGLCSNDQYEPAYLICLFILEESRYPLLKFNNQVGQVVEGVKKIVREMEIRRCSKGTPHIWYARPKLNEHLRDLVYKTADDADIHTRKKWEKVLMKRECQTLATLIHHWSSAKNNLNWESELSSNAYHMNFSSMKQILGKFPEIYPYNVMAAMHNVYSQCRSCNPDHKTQQLQWPNITFDDEEMKQFRSRQEETRQKFLNLKNNKMVNKIESSVKKSEHQYIQLKGASTNQPSQNSFGDNNDDQKVENTSQILELLKEFEQYPEVASFLNNDLIWNEESGPPPDMYEFEEQIFTHDRKMFIKKYGYDRMRRVIVVITDKMRDMYEKYGDYVCINYIPSLIKRRSPAGWHFTIGVFTGQDSNLQDLLFGICFLSEDLMIYHKKSLQYFFEGMEERVPLTLITSNEKAICQAIDLLQSENPKYNFKHHIGWFYVVEHLKELLVGQLDQQAMLKLYCRSIAQKNPLIYKQLLKIMTSRMVQRPVIEQFAKKSSKYCLSELEPCFIGFSLSTDQVLKVYKMIQNSFIYQGRVAKFFYDAFKLQRKLTQQSNQIKTANNINLLLQAEPIIQQKYPTTNQYLGQLYEVGHYLQQQPYKILFSSYMTSLECLAIEEQPDITNHKQSSISQQFTIKLIEHRKDLDIKFRYPLVYSTESDHWLCPCKWIYLTGLPCHHLLKVLSVYGGSIRYYINSRWLI